MSEDADDSEVNNPLNTVAVFKIKTNTHGECPTYKTRLCVQGFGQRYGLDYLKTYAPTGKVALLRAVLTYAADKNLDLLQLDVKEAFLHSELEEKVFIKTPYGCNQKSKYLCLKKSLYGLKEAPRNWYRMLSDVDRFKKAFLSKFNNSSAHKPNTLLGMKVEREKGLIHLSLPLHIEKGLIKMNLTDCRGASTPLTPGSHLKPADDEDHKRFIELNTKYRSPIGRLNFIAGLARPDISFAVSNLAKFCKKPGLSHWNKIIRVWKYLGNTKDI